MCVYSCLCLFVCVRTRVFFSYVYVICRFLFCRVFSFFFFLFFNFIKLFLIYPFIC